MLVRNQVAAVLSAVGAAFVLHIALNVIFGIGVVLRDKFIPGNLTVNMLVTSDPTAGQATTRRSGAVLHALVAGRVGFFGMPRCSPSSERSSQRGGT